jgi:hypothetical protein
MCVFNSVTENIFKKVKVKNLTSMATLRDMKTINAGIFTDVFDFNLATICLTHFLDRKYKNMCSNMTGVAPTATGSLLFFQVKQLKKQTTTNYL